MGVRSAVGGPDERLVGYVLTVKSIHVSFIGSRFVVMHCLDAVGSGVGSIRGADADVKCVAAVAECSSEYVSRT